MNLSLVKVCLAASARAYSEASFSDAQSSTEGFVWKLADDEVVLAFRGSHEPRDFIMDAKFLAKEKWPGHDFARVHRGFWRGYKAVANAATNAVARASRIVITGHSLGGARALLCAAHLVEMGLPVSDVITFGCPRVGNAAFRDFYNEELHDITVRVEAQGDPVPWTPPWLLNGYRHVGRSLYLHNDGTHDLDPVLSLPVNYALTKFGPRPTALDSQLFGLFAPHAIQNYTRLLNLIPT